MDHIEIIKRIFKLRKKYSINQDNMGGMIGVSGNTVSRWENRKSIPHKVFRKKMEEILAFRPKRPEEENNGKENNEK